MTKSSLKYHLRQNPLTFIKTNRTFPFALILVLYFLQFRFYICIWVKRALFHFDLCKSNLKYSIRMLRNFRKKNLCGYIYIYSLNRISILKYASKIKLHSFNLIASAAEVDLDVHNVFVNNYMKFFSFTGK